MNGQIVGARIGVVIGFYTSGPAGVPFAWMGGESPGELLDPEVIEERPTPEGESA